MKKAKLTINTQVDEQEDMTATFSADMQLSVNSALLSYVDGGAKVTLSLQNGAVNIRREGDYTLNLHLVEGEELPASLGILGNEGRIRTQTKAIHYSITRESLLLSIKYAILFSKEERQEMKIRLIARI